MTEDEQRELLVNFYAALYVAQRASPEHFQYWDERLMERGITFGVRYDQTQLRPRIVYQRYVN